MPYTVTSDKVAGTLRVPFAATSDKVAGTLRVPFAVELLPGFQVDGTWNVPTTLVDGTWNVPTTLVDYFDFCRLHLHCPEHVKSSRR